MKDILLVPGCCTTGMIDNLGHGHTPKRRRSCDRKTCSSRYGVGFGLLHRDKRLCSKRDARSRLRAEGRISMER